MLAKAIEKINSEMNQNANNSYIQVVGSFLLQYLKTNPEAAEKILSDDKTIGKSLEAMSKEAQKKKVGNCAVLTDQEGFTIVLRYFGIEGAAPASAPLVFESSPRPSQNPTKQPEVSFDVRLEDLLNG